MFLGKGIPEICSKFTEHSCGSVISIKLQCNNIFFAGICQAGDKGKTKTRKNTHMQRTKKGQRYFAIRKHQEKGQTNRKKNWFSLVRII